MADVTTGQADIFSADCRRCSRLAHFLDEVRQDFPGYYSRPVPPFGDAKAWLLIVGLAPGMHGANRSGRPFTGDYAGVLLYRTLHKFGFANRAQSLHADDGLLLSGCRITNAVKCLPPENKPAVDEVRRCNAYLAAELAALPKAAAVLALGGIAHKAVLMAVGEKAGNHKFAHGVQYRLECGLTLFDSYHCSRYNTQTKRLTEPMFEQVFTAIGRFFQCRTAAAKHPDEE
ncbi:MAG: uracil-DNA glycosylase [Betaproteobacteria bacterium]